MQHKGDTDIIQKERKTENAGLFIRTFQRKNNAGRRAGIFRTEQRRISLGIGERRKSGALGVSRGQGCPRFYSDARAEREVLYSGDGSEPFLRYEKSVPQLLGGDCKKRKQRPCVMGVRGSCKLV